MFFRKKKNTLGQPQTLSNRISTLLRANIHAALDNAEDPAKMLDQFVRDFTENIRAAEDAVAQTIGNLRLMEKNREDAFNETRSWGQKALVASNRADTAQHRGDAIQTAKLNHLATIALTNQLTAEKKVNQLDPQISSQNANVEQLKLGLLSMQQKLSDLKAKRTELLARAKVAQAQSMVVTAVTALNSSDPTSELHRVEQSVRQQEALVAGRVELAASSLEAQFDELESLGETTEVQDRLARLKSNTPHYQIGS